MKTRYLCLFVFFFGSAIYLNTIPNSYAYDDFSVVEGNKFTRQGAGGIISHLLHDSFTGFTGQENLFRGGRYRPLSLVTFSVEYELFGLNPNISHIINVALYGLICLLLFRMLTALFLEKSAYKKPADYFLSLALVSTLIFAAHPVHTEVVANIKGRDELMALLFGLLSWIAVLRYADSNRPVQALLGGVFLFLALMSKESAMPLLVLIPVSLFCFRPGTIARKTLFRSVAALATGFLLFMLIRQSVTGWSITPLTEDNILSNSFIHASGISERYGTTFYTLWLYLKLLFFPHPLTIDYYPFYIPYVGMADLRAILPLILYAVLTISALVLTFRRNVAGFGLLFYLTALLPVSNLLFIVGPFMGERFLFIPSVGFVLALTWGLIRLANRFALNKVLPYFFPLILVLFTVKTISRNSDWKDNYTLYTRDALTSVNSAVICRGAGHELLIKAQSSSDLSEKRSYARQAIAYLEQAVGLNKSTTETLLLGNAHYENGNYEKALEAYLETLKLVSTYEKALSNYFITVNRLPSPSLKIRYYDELITTVGPGYEVYYYKGLVFGKEMNIQDSAVHNLERAIEIDSTRVDCLSDLGVALAINGNLAKSAYYFEKALRVSPQDRRIRQNLTSLYHQMGNEKRVRELSAMP